MLRIAAVLALALCSANAQAEPRPEPSERTDPAPAPTPAETPGQDPVQREAPERDPSPQGTETPAPSPAEWNLERVQTLELALIYLQADKVRPAYIEAMKKFPHPSCEEAKELDEACRVAVSLAFAAQDKFLIQELRAGKRSADRALEIYNELAKKFDVPTREIDSPKPSEPESLKAERAARAKADEEKALREARTWTPEKVRVLGERIDLFCSGKKVSAKTQEKIGKLREVAVSRGYHLGGRTSGKDYEEFAKAAEALLSAYNSAVPAARRHRVGDL